MAIPLEQGSWTFRDLSGTRTGAGWTRADPGGRGPCSFAEWQEVKRLFLTSGGGQGVGIEIGVWGWRGGGAAIGRMLSLERRNKHI